MIFVMVKSANYKTMKTIMGEDENKTLNRGMYFDLQMLSSELPCCYTQGNLLRIYYNFTVLSILIAALLRGIIVFSALMGIDTRKNNTKYG